VRNAIIFCNRKKDVDILQKSLARHGFDVAALHGDLPQAKRTETLERFKNDEIRLLVASDVAARGLDIQGLSHVFNFDVPIHAEDYVHRIGRTGRAGLKGRAFTIAAPEDGRFVAAIVTLIGKDIPVAEVEGIATEQLVYDDTRRGRGRGRPAPTRAARRPEPRRPRAEANPPVEAQVEPVGIEAAQPAPRAEPNREPRRGDGRRQRQPRPQHAPVATAQPIRMTPEGMDRASNVTVLADAAGRRDERGRSDHHHEDHEDRRVVGFGDHLPAFLARPVRLAGG